MVFARARILLRLHVLTLGLIATGIGTGLSTFVVAPKSFAFTQTVTPGGKPVRWVGVAPKIPLAANPTNSSGLSNDQVFTAVTHGLQRWKAAAGGRLDFDYWQGTDTSTFNTTGTYDGLTSLFFASNAKAAIPGMTANVLGLTQVWYNANTGEVLEADVVLNDNDYHFTLDPQDTSGYGSGSAGGNRVFIENVITHELGHAFGLSHSGGLQSTMLFMESPEQAHLGCDEQVGIRTVYGSTGAPSGGLSGHVVFESGHGPVFGAQVVAISQSRGTALATAITDKNGGYSFAALEPGSYYLMVEPFYAGSTVLPTFYANASTRICSGRDFTRTFLLDGGDGNRLAPLAVSSGAASSAPDLTVRCEGFDVAPSSGSQALISPSAPASGYGWVDRVTAGDSRTYNLGKVSGSLRLHSLAYSLYSPLRTRLELLDIDGRSVDARTDEPVYTGDSGYVNYDAALAVDDLPEGEYAVRVSTEALSAQLYPGGGIALDAVPFLVLTGSRTGDVPSDPTLPANARCRAVEQFADYTSPATTPFKRTLADDNSKGGGFCASISAVAAAARDRDGKGPGAPPPSPPSAGALAGWFLPFALMAAFARGMRRWARRAASRAGQLTGGSVAATL